jgi:uncharacterized membrane protein YraQ (UPF0718 family)
MRIEKVERRTLALRAFFMATPATRRISMLLPSFATSAESMSMYVGYIDLSVIRHGDLY